MKTILVVATSLWASMLAAQSDRPLTCNPADIEPRSYRLTTEIQARIVTEDRYDFWDGFELGKHEEVVADLNGAATRAAEHAVEIDPGNGLAQSILARQYLVVDEPELAEAAWRKVMDAGGSVVWTATLYDVDARSYFVMVFSRRSIRIYRFGALTARLDKGFYGIPKFPGPEDSAFWRALAGCVPADAVLEAEVPWEDVSEIKAGNWVLWFKLTRPIAVTSDRGKKEKLKEIKVCLHGRTGSLEVYKPTGEENPALRGRGPIDYQDLVRWTLVKFVDPERRIVMPPAKPGVGW